MAEINSHFLLFYFAILNYLLPITSVEIKNYDEDLLISHDEFNDLNDGLDVIVKCPFK